MATYRILRLPGRDDIKGKVVTYGANTCWWFDDYPPYRTPGITAISLPCDPRGGMLFETPNVADFLDKAEKNAEDGYYGKHGLKAFFAAYHGVVEVLQNGRWLPTCFRGWDKYNDALDILDVDGGDFVMASEGEGCTLCHGCLPPDEQCQACGRVNKTGFQC